MPGNMPCNAGSNNRVRLYTYTGTALIYHLDSIGGSDEARRNSADLVKQMAPLAPFIAALFVFYYKPAA